MLRALGLAPLDLVRELVRARGLLWSLAQRELAARYRGSVFGIAWALLVPMLMLGVYTFVFGVIFKARWTSGAVGDDRVQYAAIIFAGMIVYSFFAESVARAPSSILSNSTYVKKVIFPLGLLPIVPIAVALMQALISFAVLLALLGFSSMLTALAPLALLCLIPLMILTAGVSLALASLGVFFRDIGNTVGIVLSALMFLSPVFYPRSAVPARFQTLITWNPLTIPVEEMRNVLILGQSPSPVELGWSLLVALIVFWIGAALFSAFRGAFADVI